MSDNSKGDLPKLKLKRFAGLSGLMVLSLIAIGAIIYFYAPTPKAVLGRMLLQSALLGDAAIAAEGAAELPVKQGEMAAVDFWLEGQRRITGSHSELFSRLGVNWQGLGVKLEGFVGAEDLILKLPLQSTYSVLTLDELMPSAGERFGLDFSTPGLRRDLNRQLPLRVLALYNSFMDALPESDAKLIGLYNYERSTQGMRYQSLSLELSATHLSLLAAAFKEEVLADGAVIEVLMKWAEPEKRQALQQEYQRLVSNLDALIAFEGQNLLSRWENTRVTLRVGYDWLYRPRAYSVVAVLPEKKGLLKLVAHVDYRRQHFSAPKLTNSNHTRVNLEGLQAQLEGLNRFMK